MLKVGAISGVLSWVSSHFSDFESRWANSCESAAKYV